MTVGKSPVAGSSYALQDGRWLLGVAAGNNRAYQNGITAHAGGTKAAAFQLPANVQLFEIDTVANAGDSVLMPAALQGQIIDIFNNGASNLDIYGRGTDTINQSATATAYVLTPGQCAHFFCAKNGLWGANKTA
jgi:O-acetylhomoserine/O-acetylserine sulfhydrylase-like pyridoxal-dependent enzyme